MRIFGIAVFKVSNESMGSKGRDEWWLGKLTAKGRTLHIHAERHVFPVCFSSYYHLLRNGL
jgi:hypothetical protein